jgi:protein-glutamine gamma-glutamyltransferase
VNRRTASLEHPHGPASPAGVQHSPRWGAGAALVVLVMAAAAAWYQVLGPPVSQVAPLAAVAVLVAAGWLPRRVAVGALVACAPAALLLAGLPVAQLRPEAWPSSVAQLEAGTRRLAAPGSAYLAHDSWPLAAGLLLAGTAWLAAGALAAPASPSGGRTSASFVIAALPWIAALARAPASTPAWQGALVLFAGLLWCSSWRMAARPAMALGVVVALVSAATAQTVGPERRWFGLPSPAGGPASFRALGIEPTFGPLPDRRVGRSMLEIRAAQPALWRMQVLDVFDGFGWRVAREADSELPQPAARRVWVDVRVRGLRNDLAVAPGHIARIAGGGRRQRVAGDAWRLTPPPHDGAHYRVLAEVVRARADELRRAPPPSDPRLRRYTQLGWPPYFGIVLPLLGAPSESHTTAMLARTPYRLVAALARRLAAGADTEWQVVARVQRYLLDSDRFRYTTDVPAPGLLPLVDFLLHDHAGYCQHFAGAAALLLRLAGVPARLVAGFATGAPERGGFDVRDVDAHDWVEVYFQGYGWVPFNPTPPADPARVDRRLDLLAPASMGADRSWLRGRTVGALLAALALSVLSAARRRPRCARTQPHDLLARVARRAGARVGPSSTLSDLQAELALRLGPHTSALAAAAERARYAPGSPAPGPRPRARIVRALISDLGPRRAALLLLLPAARDPSRRRA